jgi:hypothetical protein
MPNKPLKERCLPTREICYAYAAAMHFAQAFEQNLRAFIYTMDYHGWIEEIPLTEDQRKRYKDFDGFIDKSTCGFLLEKLRGTSTIKKRSAWKTFDRACDHRNRLAHRYLMEHDFIPDMNEASEQAIIRELNSMAMDLYAAFVISQAIREHAEHESDKREQVWAKFNDELGFPSYDDMKRKYVAPFKREK